MKITKRKVLVVALAVCLIAIISMSTLAWFSAEDSAKNVFYVTNSDKTEDDIFSVDVTEFVADDGEEKKPVDGGYEFKDILPGDKLTKQPFVTNTGSYDQFVRVTITVSDLAAFKNIFGANYETLVRSNFLGNLNVGYSEDENHGNAMQGDLVLDSVVEDTANDQLVYTLYVREILAPGESVEIFNKTMIPYQLEQADFVAPSTLSDGFEINVSAEAIQTENLGDSGEAKATFEYYERFNAIMP